MFEAQIIHTAFTTQAARNYFSGKIEGDSFMDDYSFLSTMRALLWNRIGDDSLNLSMSSISYNRSQVERMSAREWGEYLAHNYCARNMFSVVNLKCADDSVNQELFQRMENGIRDGYVRLPSITDFFRRNFDVLCFVNKERKSSLFILKKANIKVIHQVQIAAISALPWYFDPSKGDRLTEEEHELLTSLQEKTHDHYIECLKKIADKIDFEVNFLRDKLNQIETAYERGRIEQVKRDIQEIIDNIRRYQEAINQFYSAINDRNIELLGLEEKVSSGSGESPLLNYFLANKNLQLTSIDRTRIKYYIKTYLSIYDKRQALACINNQSSFIYRRRQNIPTDTVKEIVRAIFIDQKVKIRTCAAYYIDMTGGFGGINDFNFGEDSFDRMPNPHIQHYTCIGDHRSAINDRIMHRDFVGAIDQTACSAASIAFNDPTVMDTMFGELFRNYTTRWFELPDGTRLNLPELVEMLEKEKENE